MPIGRLCCPSLRLLQSPAGNRQELPSFRTPDGIDPPDDLTFKLLRSD